MITRVIIGVAAALCAAAAAPGPSRATNCAGDCDGDGQVVVTETVVGINIALGDRPATDCPAMDAGGDGAVTVDELLQAVGALLQDCPVTPLRVLDAQTGTPIAGATVTFSDYSGAVTLIETAAGGGVEEVPAGAVLASAGAGGWLTRTFARPALVGDVRLARDPDPADDDADGVSNGNEAAAGTNPLQPDTDGDGIPDWVETRISPPFGAPALGANPLHKTLFAEIWYDERSHLSEQQLAAMRAMYADAPVANPDGVTGITVIIDTGAFGGGGVVTDVDNNCDYTLGVLRDAGYMRPERDPYFFYAWGDADLTDLCGVNGEATFERTLIFDANQTALYGGLADVIEWSTWAHELGHNLDLLHSGGPGTSGECKPNYPSIMNYNIVMISSLGYSRGLLPPLDENALDERVGIPGFVEPAFHIDFGIPLDWNHNGVIDSEPVRADVNNLLVWDGLSPRLQPLIASLYRLYPGFAQRCPVDGHTTVLEDYDDWGYIERNLYKQVGPLPEPFALPPGRLASAGDGGQPPVPGRRATAARRPTSPPPGASPPARACHP
jgi:hypothetical protein